MRTIRTNCFETNSSSTHSITIVSGNLNAYDVPSLAENNILYPARITDENIRAAFLSSPDPRNYGNSSWTFTASTRSTKAALIVHYIYSILSSEELDEAQLADVLNQLASYMGYDAIDLGPSFYDMYSISRYDGQEEYGEEVNKMLEFIGYSIHGNKVLIDMQRLGLYVQSIVMDDTKSLVDFSESY